MIWKLVEKFKNRPPKTAREVAGFPIEMEFKQVGPEQDDRIMADGRPAHAWWYEIQMLRRREPDLQKKEKDLREQFRILRIAEWAFYPEIISDDVLLRIKRLPLALNKNPETELLEHPEKYISVEQTK